MDQLPSPMSPPDCDLRGYDFMPLFGHKLFGSTLYTESSAEEFRAAIKLWWTAWNQVPAGSLPSSDQALATFADCGRDLKSWARMKARALHGFVLCSDGRLYHPILSEEAVDSYQKRLKSSAKRKNDAERLRAWREEQDRLKRGPTAPRNAAEVGGETLPETRSETLPETSVKRVSESVDSDNDSDKEEGRGELKLSKRRTTRAPDVVLPPWMPVEAWNGYLDMRRRKGKPPTPRAIELVIRELDAFRQRGLDVEAALNQSTVSDWTGVFEPRGGRTQPQNGMQALGAHIREQVGDDEWARI